MIDERAIEEHIRGILAALGDDPEREGLKDTPKRVAQMYAEVFAGMNYTNHEIAEMFGKTFEEGLEKDDATAVTRFIWKGRASEPKYRAEWLELLEKSPVLGKYRKDAENCCYLWTQAAVLPAVMDAIACAGRKTI